MASEEEPSVIIQDLIYHTGLGFIYVWNILWNITIIILIIAKKIMRTDGQKMLVINICICFIVEALLGLFTQARDIVPEVQEFYESTGLCDGIIIANLAVDILVPYSLILLCIDLCVQLKETPFYAPSAGRSVCMMFCHWLLSAALTFLLLFGVGRLERGVDNPECYIHLTLLYTITERCITFFTPAFMLIIAILFLVCLSCKGHHLTTLELHRGNPDIEVIQHAKKLSPAVVVISTFFLLLWAPYNALYFMDAVLHETSFVFYMTICKHVAMATGAIIPIFWLTVDPDLRRACCGCCKPRKQEDYEL